MSYTYHSSVPALRTSLADWRPRGHCSQSYGYDAGWNMTSRNTTSYTVNDRNQVTGDGAVTYTYDANGNRTSSSNYRTWAYDDENQLLSVEQYQSWRTEFTYDGRQRLRVRKEFTWNAGYGAWQLSGETRYIYDGMLVLQERNSGNVPQISYGRGLDLSGSLHGAGGIGGLLARYRHATTSPYAINGASFYHADGNGNVTYLANSAGGADAAYRYDPFGRWLAGTGSYAAANVMRFSSKPWIAHNGSATDGLYSYGYRFYDPNLQRWPNRDPLGEPGFEVLRGNGPNLLGDSANLYLFVFNNPNSWIDLYGLAALNSITASIEACMQLPTPAARLSCLERLFGDVCFNPRNANAVKNALRGARNQAGKETLKDKSSHQLSSEVSKAAKDWLRNRCDCKPSREELEKLREIARRAVEQGKDTLKKIQEDRLRRIDDALNELLE